MGFWAYRRWPLYRGFNLVLCTRVLYQGKQGLSWMSVSDMLPWLLDHQCKGEPFPSLFASVHVQLMTFRCIISQCKSSGGTLICVSQKSYFKIFFFIDFKLQQQQQRQEMHCAQWHLHPCQDAIQAHGSWAITNQSSGFFFSNPMLHFKWAKCLYLYEVYTFCHINLKKKRESTCELWIHYYYWFVIVAPRKLKCT